MLDSVKNIVLEAGKIALEYFNNIDKIKIESKANPKDVVTEADQRVEEFLKIKLFELNPDFGFLGEETGESGQKEARWIVDPIDGTHSFIREQYFWAISVALEINNSLEIGVVFAPRLNDLYYAERGKGAFKNSKKINVSAISEMSESMVATGFACLRDDLVDNNLDRFKRIAEKTMGQRRFGSAALDLCMVADGQLDSFWEQNLNLYDVAAGCLLVLEAGGVITDFKGNKAINPNEIFSSNGRIHQEMLKYFAN